MARFICPPGLTVRAFVAALLLLSAGCGKTSAPPSSPAPAGPGETITGSERIGWDQQAANAVELASFGYAIFVDGNRSVMSAVSCGASPAGGGFSCSGRLPAMSAGTHALRLSAFVVRDGETLESPPSTPLTVVVAGAVAAQRSVAPGVVPRLGRTGAMQVRVILLADDLQHPTDMAVGPDERVFVTEASGRVSIVTAGRRQTALEPVPDTRLVALALDPQFARSRFVYLLRAGVDGTASVFRLMRYREAGGTLGEAATLLDNVPASVDRPAAALRFGPDGKLYAAFEEQPDAPRHAAAYNGQILRLNPDGTTPADQRSGSPVLAPGARRPSGLAWDRDGMLWIIDGDAERVERVIGVHPPSAQGGRPQRVVHALPVPFGAAGAAFDEAGDLWIGAETAGYVLRVRFDPSGTRRVVGTERLLEGDVDSVRAIGITAAGSLLLCTSTSLVALDAAPPR